MSAPDLKDYIEVPDRIRDFKEKFPEGSLQGQHELVEVGGKLFVQYIAKAYRSPLDPRPGIGTTWEPFPGTTPYTKNSEIENAETSAWGRALVAIGFVGKKIASATEVRNRSAEQADGESKMSSHKTGAPKLSDKQKNLIKKLVGQKELTIAQLEIMLTELEVVPPEVNEGWVDNLTGGRDGQGSALIDRLMNGPIPEAAPVKTPESDIPDDGDFKHPPAGDTTDTPIREAA